METSYGASAASPEAAAGVLRALASRHGVNLAPASQADLAAAAVAAEVWVCLTGSNGFTEVHSADAADVLAAIVTLAATGHASPPCGARVSADPVLLRHALESAEVWLERWFLPPHREPGVFSTVVAAACGCLCAAGPDSRFAAAADLVADHFDAVAGFLPEG